MSVRRYSPVGFSLTNPLDAANASRSRLLSSANRRLLKKVHEEGVNQTYVDMVRDDLDDDD